MVKKQITLALLIITLLVACSPVSSAPQQPNLETVVAETIQALTAVPVQVTQAPATVNGTPVTFSKISFAIPEGIATSATEEKVELSLPAEGMPWWATYPAHVRYPVEGYLLTEQFHEPEIFVYPIAEYIAINEDVAKKIETLKSLIANPNQPAPERLPFLPTFNAGEMFHSNFGTVTFQNGSGIRYITAFSQFPHPIYNTDMIYTFQGITNDEMYYVAAVLPINIGFLIGYPTPSDQGNFEEIEKQVELVTQQLNNSTPESFTPSMVSLDAMIQSMNVTGIP